MSIKDWQIYLLVVGILTGLTIYISNYGTGGGMMFWYFLGGGIILGIYRLWKKRKENQTLKKEKTLI